MKQNKPRAGRRSALASVATWLIVVAAAASTPAAGQDRRITFVVGYPAGGATDALARILAEDMRSRLDATIIVENKPGAGGRIATNFVKNAKPDGNTLLFSISSTMVIYPHIYQNLSYDPIKDFVPIAIGARSVLCLSVGPAVPDSVRTVADYVTWVKANPSLASFGTVAGTAPHFAGLLFAKAAGLDLRITPYKGGSQAITDLLGGHIPATVTPVSEAEHFQGTGPGRLRILATMGPQRPKVLPDKPTMMELGYKDVNFQAWIGLFAPAGTSAATVRELNAAVMRTVGQEGVAAKIERLGMEPVMATPEQFAALVHSDLELFGKSVALTGFKAED